jgi:hypothetical protein
MKKLPVIVISVLFSAVSFSSAQQTTVASETPKVEVISPTDASDLARGYESAFQKMSASRVIIYIRMEERIQKLEFVRDVRASGGVLVIEMRDNNLIAVDARRIVLMTNGKMSP